MDSSGSAIVGPPAASGAATPIAVAVADPAEVTEGLGPAELAELPVVVGRSPGAPDAPVRDGALGAIE